jgi:hypothetical protein
MVNKEVDKRVLWLVENARAPGRAALMNGGGAVEHSSKSARAFDFSTLSDGYCHAPGLSIFLRCTGSSKFIFRMPFNPFSRSFRS